MVQLVSNLLHLARHAGMTRIVFYPYQLRFFFLFCPARAHAMHCLFWVCCSYRVQLVNHAMAPLAFTQPSPRAAFPASAGGVSGR